LTEPYDPNNTKPVKEINSVVKKAVASYLAGLYKKQLTENGI
jgi:hypothetical protein